MKTYHLGDLLDLRMLQRLADSNFKASGLPLTIVDAIDLAVLVKAGWPEICDVFHRAHPLSEKRCRLSDSYVADHLGEGETLQYKCHNGLWHIALPIVAAGRHVANLFLNQFFFEGESPDMDVFARQARELGFDVDRYLAAVKALPVFSRERVDYILAYDKALVEFIADLAEQAIQIIETKQSLVESEAKYRSLVDNVNVGICRLAEDGKFIQANPAMAKIFGYESVYDLMQTNISTLYRAPTDWPSCIKDLKRHKRMKNRDMAMRKKDGTPIWCAATVTSHHDMEGKILWLDGVVEDITERKDAREQLQVAHDQLEYKVRARTFDLEKSNELLLREIAERKRFEGKLKELSETDPLTSIFNRRKFFELLDFEIKKEKRYHRPLSLLMFDLDRFKRVNDTYGHGVGDTVLSKTAAIVSKTIRSTDIFARYGGEEFIMILSETDLSGSLELAEKIRSAIAGHRFFKAGRITVSIGVAQFTGTESETEFINRVDSALYSAKQTGRNRVVAAGQPAN